MTTVIKNPLINFHFTVFCRIPHGPMAAARCFVPHGQLSRLLWKTPEPFVRSDHRILFFSWHIKTAFDLYISWIGYLLAAFVNDRRWFTSSRNLYRDLNCNAYMTGSQGRAHNTSTVKGLIYYCLFSSTNSFWIWFLWYSVRTEKRCFTMDIPLATT